MVQRVALGYDLALAESAGVLILVLIGIHMVVLAFPPQWYHAPTGNEGTQWSKNAFMQAAAVAAA
jgi:hypothetical protein